MENLTDSVSAILQRYQRKAELLDSADQSDECPLRQSTLRNVNCLQSEPSSPIHLKASTTCTETLLDGFLQQNRELEEHKLQISELKSVVSQFAAENAKLSSDLEQLQRDFEIQKLNGGKSPNSLDAVAVKQLIFQQFSEYRQDVKNNFAAVKNLCKLTTLDRSSMQQLPNALEHLAHSVEMVEKQNQAFQSVQESENTTLQQQIDDVIHIQREHYEMSQENYRLGLVMADER